MQTKQSSINQHDAQAQHLWSEISFFCSPSMAVASLYMFCILPLKSLSLYHWNCFFFVWPMDIWLFSFSSLLAFAWYCLLNPKMFRLHIFLQLINWNGKKITIWKCLIILEWNWKFFVFADCITSTSSHQYLFSSQVFFPPSSSFFKKICIKIKVKIMNLEGHLEMMSSIIKGKKQSIGTFERGSG